MSPILPARIKALIKTALETGPGPALFTGRIKR